MIFHFSDSEGIVHETSPAVSFADDDLQINISFQETSTHTTGASPYTVYITSP